MTGYIYIFDRQITTKCGIALTILLESETELTFMHLTDQTLNFKHVIGQIEDKTMLFSSEMFDVQTLVNQIADNDFNVRLNLCASVIVCIRMNARDVIM